MVRPPIWVDNQLGPGWPRKERPMSAGKQDRGRETWIGTPALLRDDGAGAAGDGTTVPIYSL